MQRDKKRFAIREKESKKMKLEACGILCEVSFVNGSSQTLNGDDGINKIQIGCVTGIVQHDVVCPGEKGAAVIPASNVYRVTLTQPLTADLQFGDTWIDPETNRSYTVIGTAKKHGTYQGVAAAAGEQCLRVIDQCCCQDGTVAPPLPLDNCIQFPTPCASGQIQGIDLPNIAEVTGGPWTVANYQDSQTGIKAAFGAQGIAIDDVIWDGTTMTIKGPTIVSDGQNVVVDCV